MRWTQRLSGCVGQPALRSLCLRSLNDCTNGRSCYDSHRSSSMSVQSNENIKKRRQKKTWKKREQEEGEVGKKTRSAIAASFPFIYSKADHHRDPTTDDEDGNKKRCWGKKLSLPPAPLPIFYHKFFGPGGSCFRVFAKWQKNEEEWTRQNLVMSPHGQWWNRSSTLKLKCCPARFDQCLRPRRIRLSN